MRHFDHILSLPTVHSRSSTPPYPSNFMYFLLPLLSLSLKMEIENENQNRQTEKCQ